eukprot:7162148-Prymnesium_polylepis.3
MAGTARGGMPTVAEQLAAHQRHGACPELSACRPSRRARRARRQAAGTWPAWRRSAPPSAPACPTCSPS